MTDDPVKLYVILMTVLLCILVFVAVTSYNMANNYAMAVETAPRFAKQMREYSANVQRMCEQLGKGGSRRETYIQLLESRARQFQIKAERIRPDDKPVGRGVKEKRYSITISRKSPAGRQAIANYCREIEARTRTILKTIELDLNRVGTAGKDDDVVDDRYYGTLVFGYRYTE